MSADVSLAIGDRGPRWFALAFVLTQLAEVPIYARALRSTSRPDPSQSTPSRQGGLPTTAGSARRLRPWHARAAIAFGASALTHPLVWYLFPPVTAALLAALARAGVSLDLPARTLVYGALAEGFAVLAEAAYLRAFGVPRALAWSLAANTASVIFGTAVVQLLA